MAKRKRKRHGKLIQITWRTPERALVQVGRRHYEILRQQLQPVDEAPASIIGFAAYLEFQIAIGEAVAREKAEELLKVANPSSTSRWRRELREALGLDDEDEQGE